MVLFTDRGGTGQILSRVILIPYYRYDTVSASYTVVGRTRIFVGVHRARVKTSPSTLVIVLSSREVATEFCSRRTYGPVLVLAVGRLHARNVDDVGDPNLVRSVSTVAFHLVVEKASQVLTQV